MSTCHQRQDWLGKALFGPGARRAWRGLLAVLMLAVCGLAFDPTPGGPSVGHLDKWLHLLAFVPLSFVSCWAVAADARGAGARPAVWSAGVAMLTFGVFIEAGQAFIPARSASAADVLADALGIGIGLLLAQGLGRLVGSAPARAGAHPRG